MTVNNINDSNTAVKYELGCEQFAAINQVKTQTVRARLCRTGSYYGVLPLKLANGRLVWPAVQVAA
jgi:hypothetical protein